MKCLYRVNCGNTGTARYKDKLGGVWLPDQEKTAGREWGCLGGSAVTREKALPLHDSRRPEIYRFERCGAHAYEFALPDATYAVKLYFAETFESYYRAGLRSFDVTLNGLRVLHEFDPYAAAGGFARGCVMEFGEVGAPGGKLTIALSGNAAINGIEIFAVNPKPAARRERKRLLFVGNSLVIFWNLPGTLECFINAHPNAMHLETHRALLGGMDLVYHYDKTDVAQRIEEGRYDYVVVQSTRSRAPGWEAQFMEYAAKYQALVTKSGGKLALYCDWPPADAPLSEYDVTSKAHYAAAQKLGMLFVPVGPAWKKALIARPKLRLHNSADNVHPGLHGAYLTACVFYGVLTGKQPQGHVPNVVIGGQVEVEAKKAAFLQRIAGEALGEYGNLGF